LTTSEAKIAANRRNAGLSTGPRTLRGKLHSARNALRHGLAAKLSCQPNRSVEVERLSRLLIAAFQKKKALADTIDEIAEAQADVIRVRSVRISIFESIADGNFAHTKHRDPTADRDHREMRPNANGACCSTAGRLARWIQHFQCASTLLAKLDRYEDRALARRNILAQKLMSSPPEGKL